MSPSDFGEILKPFVFLDLFDHEGPPFNGPLHPHSGIATLTYVAEGAVSYIDPDNVRGTMPAGGVEWMQAGRGMWHGGGLDKAGRTRGFQLWIALPPELELGPTISIYQAPEDVPEEGPARVLLGSYGSASSAMAVPLADQLSRGTPEGRRALALPAPGGSYRPLGAIASGALSAPDQLRHGDLAAFEPSSEAVEFKALTNTQFVLGSAAPHEHDLVLGYYSVHTSKHALDRGETRIAEIRNSVNAIFDLKKNVNSPTLLNAPPDGGLLDPTFGLRYSLTAAPSPWNLVLESAVKVPIDGERQFLSTGIPMWACRQRYSASPDGTRVTSAQPRSALKAVR